MNWSLVDFCLNLFSKILAICPLQLSIFIAKRIGDVAFIMHKRKDIAYSHLRLAFGSKYTSKQRWLIVRQSYQSVACTFLELLMVASMKQDKFLSLVSPGKMKEVGDKTLASKKAGVFLTGHMDNWELLHQYPSSVFDFPLKVIAKKQKNQRLNELLNNLRSSKGTDIILRGSELKGYLEAIKSKGFIATAGDQAGKPSTDPYLEFFGYQVATPVGVFKLAMKYQLTVVPVVSVRKGLQHQFEFGDALQYGKDSSIEDVLSGAQEYLRFMEQKISQYPGQWLWGHKRWKHSRTKKICILKDGRKGHESQALAVADALKQVFESRLEDAEVIIEELDLHFKSEKARRSLRTFGFFIMPFIRRNENLLRQYFKESTVELLMQCYADVVISCGSSASSVAHFLKLETQAKVVHIMKPTFPNYWIKYDLFVALKHDGDSSGKKTVLQTLAPNQIDKHSIEKEGLLLRKKLGVSDKKVVLLLLGGDMKNYSYDYAILEQLSERLEAFLQAYDWRIILSNSRRTNPMITKLFKDAFHGKTNCPLFVDVTEPAENIPSIKALLGAADVVLTTEDSVSMTSEALNAHKQVFIVEVSHNNLPRKHAMFKKNLVDENLVGIINAHKLPVQMREPFDPQALINKLVNEKELLQKALREVL